MTVDPPPRTRRAILAAAMGAATATVVSALGRPSGVDAVDLPVVLGATNVGLGRTDILRTGGTAFSVAAAALPKNSNQTEVMAIGTNTVYPGLKVVSVATGGRAVEVATTAADATALSVHAEGVNAHGVFSQVVGNNTIAVYAGVVSGSNSYAIVAEVGPQSTAIYATAAHVAIQADGGPGFGIHSTVSTGVGVLGQSGGGIGGQFSSQSGTAIKVEGKARFTRSGRASIAKNATYVDVPVTGGLSGSPLCFANLVTYRSGVYIAAVTPTASTGKIRIRLNKVASTTSSTSVSWVVLG